MCTNVGTMSARYFGKSSKCLYLIALFHDFSVVYYLHFTPDWLLIIYQVPFMNANNLYHPHEEERLKELYQYRLLDTEAERDFDELVKIAALVCDVPVSQITLIDRDRQFLKSQVGTELGDLPRQASLCARAILEPDPLVIVEDLATDERFKDNVFVANEPHARFYAGVQLRADNELPVGMLCVVDLKSRQLTDTQLETLQALANQVQAQMKLRKQLNLLNVAKGRLERANIDLSNFAHTVAHDMKAPVRTMRGFSQLLKVRRDKMSIKERDEFLDYIDRASEELNMLIDGVLSFAQHDLRRTIQKEDILIVDVVNYVLVNLDIPEEFTIEYDKHSSVAYYTSRTGLVQILQNLVGNAIRYHDKERGTIKIKWWVENLRLHLTVSDDGPGIDKQYHQDIFKMLTTIEPKDRDGRKGTGIGLATVQRIVEKLRGEIYLESEPGKGATFEVVI